MIRPALHAATLCLAFAAMAGSAHAQYRGMAPGWPNQTGGYTAYYAPAQPAYVQANYGGQPLVYVARPVTGAYANPAYAAGYNTARVTAQRPITAAYYAPAAAAYYAPTTVQYAPSNSYTIAPAGNSSAGAEAYYHYGQPTTVNYVPPRFVYRTTYAQVPVYSYRPVTAYQPVAGQPVTCLQPTTTSTCMPQRHRWFTHSWFSHSWFNWGKPACGSHCGAAPVAAPVAVPVTTYCQPTSYGQCGQPYYPVQPNVVIPAVPAPTNVIPSTPGTIVTPIPSGPASSTVPPPPTRLGPGGTFIPADTRPSLQPGTTLPGTTLPGTTAPGGSFPVQPAPSFNPSPATPLNSPFPSGSNYPPPADPYSKSSAPIRAPQARTETPRPVDSQPALSPPTGPTLAPGVMTIPDPAAESSQPINRAPQLLDPRDKTAGINRAAMSNQRWAVVPAVWPKPAATKSLDVPVNSPYRVYQQRAQRDVHTPAANPAEYDASGWQSAR